MWKDIFLQCQSICCKCLRELSPQLGLKRRKILLSCFLIYFFLPATVRALNSNFEAELEVQVF